jgi:hypothetical protein
VDIPELRQFFDVCVCSTKGSQSLLSLLSGGDYDGDTCIFIFDKIITSLCRNVDKKPFIDTSEAESKYWQSIKYNVRGTDVETVGEMNSALSKLSTDEEEQDHVDEGSDEFEQQVLLLDACLCEVM